jgi:hypothetical protein
VVNFLSVLFGIGDFLKKFFKFPELFLLNGFWGTCREMGREST